MAPPGRPPRKGLDRCTQLLSAAKTCYEKSSPLRGITCGGISTGGLGRGRAEFEGTVRVLDDLEIRP
jgi:hypothetical protein